MNRRRLGELTIAWDSGDVAFDAIGAALPLELPSDGSDRLTQDGAAIVARVRRADAPRPSPATRGAKPVLHHAGTRCFRDAHGFTLWDGASWLRVAADGSTIDAEVHELSLEPSPAYFAAVAVTMSLMLALRAHGYFHAHACAALWPDGERWLLPAESNAGKSTLGLALLDAGARLLTDDALLLRRAGTQIEAIGWLRRLRMTHATAAVFPTLAALAVPCPPGSARDLELDPRVAFPDRGQRAMAGPFTLIFPRIGAEPSSRVLALDGADALGRLLHACAWVASEHVPGRSDQLELLRHLVDSARAYELVAGSDLLRGPRAELAAIRAKVSPR